MVASNKITVLLDVTPSSLVEGDHRFGESGCFHFQCRSLEDVRMKTIFLHPPPNKTSVSRLLLPTYTVHYVIFKSLLAVELYCLLTQKFTACQLRFHRITCMYHQAPRTGPPLSVKIEQTATKQTGFGGVGGTLSKLLYSARRKMRGREKENFLYTHQQCGTQV